MFRVKICGVKTVEQALAAVDAGADAIGLNFYPASPRFIDEERASTIARAIPSGIMKVGVFVNSPSTDVGLCADRLGLDLIQLHGDEPPAYLAELDGRPVMKAFRGLQGGLQQVTEYLQLCLNDRCRPRMVLIDAASVAGQYGGTGKVADWEAAAGYRQLQGVPPLILAGGLTPENVAIAIRTVRPFGVDTASGVESNPGEKDPVRMKAFVRVSRETLGEMA